jgi:hypothetical protein
MGTFLFDSGALFGISNAVGALPVPVKFASLQGVAAKVGFKTTDSPLQLQTAIGKTIDKLTLNFVAKTAQINGRLLNQILYGSAITTGSQNLARDVAFSVPAVPPYTFTASLGTFLQDLGIQYSATGEPLVPVVGPPAQGQYSLDTSTGIYTFSAADVSQALVANYLYSLTTGNQLALTNAWKQIAPTFQAVLSTQYDGKQVTWNLPACVSTQLAMNLQLEKFNVAELQFSALSNASLNIGNFSYSD